MSYLSLYNYVRDIAIQLPGMAADRYFHGRKPLITTADVPETGVYVWCLPFTSSGTFVEIGQQFINTVSINIIFYKYDQLDSGQDQNNEDVISPEISILAETRDLAEEFVRRFNFNQEVDTGEESELLEIGTVTFDNVIKDTSHLLTGTTIELPVTVPDDFNYCSFITP